MFSLPYFFRFLVIELTSNVYSNEGTISEVKMKFKNLTYLGLRITVKIKYVMAESVHIFQS